MKKTALPILMLLTVLSAATVRSATNVWVDTFTLNVTKEALPGVTPSPVTINAVENGTATGTLTLTNGGNVAVSFSLSGSAVSTNSPYAEYEQTVSVENVDAFNPTQFAPETVFSNWDGDSTVETNIGFSTTILGTTYSNFIVNVDGTMQLTSGTDILNIYSGYTGSDFDPDWIRYKKETDRLVVAWGVNPDTTGFDPGIIQIWIHSDGTVDFLYSTGTGSSTAWYKSQRTPVEWMSATPTSGTVPKGGNVTVTFTFNGEGQPAGTENFTANVLFGNGDSASVPVNVVIGAESQQLDLPSAPTFYGPAGFITSTNITVTNSGNTALSYSIRYPSAAYTADQVDYANNWISGGDIVQSAALGSAVYELGFPFTFFGQVYTNVTVLEDGTLSFGDATIEAFANNLEVDAGASVTFRRNLSATWAVVTWNSVSPNDQSGNYTFQAVLNRDGTIRCNYLSLGAGWTNGTIQISDGTTDVSGSLSNEVTAMVTEVLVYATNTPVEVFGGKTFYGEDVVTVVGTNEVVTYASSVTGQSILFAPNARQVITAMPLTGTIAPGATADITLTGDARTLDAGGGSNVTANTTLSFAYESNTNDLAVTFIATNSMDSAYPPLSAAAVADMFGNEPLIWTEQSDSDEGRIIRWPAPQDGISRIYQVLYTPSLTQPFEAIPGAVFTNLFEFTDTDPERINSAQGYYKVSVQ